MGGVAHENCSKSWIRNESSFRRPETLASFPRSRPFSIFPFRLVAIINVVSRFLDHSPTVLEETWKFSKKEKNSTLYIINTDTAPSSILNQIRSLEKKKIIKITISLSLSPFPIQSSFSPLFKFQIEIPANLKSYERGKEKSRTQRHIHIYIYLRMKTTHCTDTERILQ